MHGPFSPLTPLIDISIRFVWTEKTDVAEGKYNDVEEKIVELSIERCSLISIDVWFKCHKFHIDL